jgi:hypothetical protein
MTYSAGKHEIDFNVTRSGKGYCYVGFAVPEIELDKTWCRRDAKDQCWYYFGRPYLDKPGADLTGVGAVFIFGVSRSAWARATQLTSHRDGRISVISRACSLVPQDQWRPRMGWWGGGYSVGQDPPQRAGGLQLDAQRSRHGRAVEGGRWQSHCASTARSRRST